VSLDAAIVPALKQVIIHLIPLLPPQTLAEAIIADLMTIVVIAEAAGLIVVDVMVEVDVTEEADVTK
jgi:hypothetical protein